MNTKPPKRRLRVVEVVEGKHFGEDVMSLRWVAEDGTTAQRDFRPTVWIVMPAWAERQYEAVVTAHPVPTRFDVIRVSNPAPASPAPAAVDSDPLTPSAGRQRRSLKGS